MSRFHRPAPRFASVLPFLRELPLRARRSFWLDYASQCLSSIFEGVAALLSMFLAKSLGGDPWLVAALRGIPGVSHLFSVFWVGPIERRRKVPFAVGLMGVGRGIFLLYLLFPGLLVPYLGPQVLPWAFSAVAAASYFTASGALPARTAIVDLVYPDTHRGRIFGFFQSARVPFAMVASYLAGVFLDRASSGGMPPYHLVFPAAGFLGLLGALVMLWLPVGRHDRPHTGPARGFSPARAWGVLRKDREFRNYMIAFSIFGFANLMQLPIQVLYLKDEFHVTYKQTSIIFAIIPQICMLLTGAFWGGFLDRVSLYTARFLFNMMWAVQPVMYALAPNIGWIYGASFVSGLSEAGSGLTWSLGILYFAPKKDIPLYMSIHLTLTGIRAVIAPQVGAFLLPVVGAVGVFWIASGIMVFSSFLMLWFGKSDREERRPGAARERASAGVPDPDLDAAG